MEIKEQIEMAKRIIERDGDCIEADCKECPFERMCDATEGEDGKFAEMLRVFVEENSENGNNVDSPKHYCLKMKGIEAEVIDVIRAPMTEEEFKGYCKGNVIKYVTRENKKNGMEDLRKAKKYLEYVIGE